MMMIDTYLLPSSCSPGDVCVGVGEDVSATAAAEVSCPLRPGMDESGADVIDEAAVIVFDPPGLALEPVELAEMGLFAKLTAS